MPSGVIGSLRVDLATNISQFASGMREAAGKVVNFKNVSRVAFGAIKKGAVAAAAGMVAATAAVVALGRRGSDLSAIEGSFRKLTAAIGESGDEMLAITRERTKGLITDINAMQAANKGLLLGLPITSESMGKLAETATVLGRAMGQDANKSLDDLITALGRSSPLILDNLGLTVKVGEANEAYALSIGKTASQLTEAEKKTAFYTAAMAAADAKVAELGGVTLTLGDRMTVVSTKITNFVDQLSIVIARSPVLNAALESVGDSMEAAFGSNQAETIQTVVSAIEDATIAAISFAQMGIAAAKGIHRAWSAVVAVYQTLVAGAIGVLETFVKMRTAVAELASEVPGVGRAFHDTAASGRDAATALEGMRKVHLGLADEAAQSAFSSSAFNDTLTDLSTGLGSVQDRMLAARMESERTGDELEQTNTDARELAAGEDELAAATAGATGQLKAQTGVLPGIQFGYVSTSDALGRLIESQGLSERGIQSWSDEVIEGTRDLSGFAGLLPRVTQNIEGLNEQLAESGSLFKSISGFIDSFAGDLNNIFQRAFEGGGGVGGAIKSFATGALSRGLNFIPVIGPVLSKFSGAFVAGFKKLFSFGPSEAELAGRESFHAYRDAVVAGLNDGQIAEAAASGWANPDDAALFISIRDTFAQIGKTEAEAEAIWRRLVSAMKEGPAAVNAIVAEIERAREESELLNDVIDHAIRPRRLDVQIMADNGQFVQQVEGQINPNATRVNLRTGGQTQAFAEGGIVTRPTMGLVGERGPEAVVPLSGAPQIVGDTSGLERRLDSIERLLSEQPDVLAVTLKTALQTAV